MRFPLEFQIHLFILLMIFNMDLLINIKIF